MNNYILSIDPSVKDTGFVLWENNKPIWINNYNFEKFNIKTSLDLKWEIRNLIIPNIDAKANNTYLWLNKLNIIIERGTSHTPNGKGAENQNILRGTICGLFNEFIKGKYMISPTTWWKFYNDNYRGIISKNIEKIKNKWILLENDLCKIKQVKKYLQYEKKELSIILANYLINKNNWNINIKNNHNIADALLIGWYVINALYSIETS